MFIKIVPIRFMLQVYKIKLMCINFQRGTIRLHTIDELPLPNFINMVKSCSAVDINLRCITFELLTVYCAQCSCFHTFWFFAIDWVKQNALLSWRAVQCTFVWLEVFEWTCLRFLVGWFPENWLHDEASGASIMVSSLLSAQERG